jgi:hypothetical protein
MLCEVRYRVLPILPRANDGKAEGALNREREVSGSSW